MPLVSMASYAFHLLSHHAMRHVGRFPHVVGVNRLGEEQSVEKHEEIRVISFFVHRLGNDAG